MPVCFPPFGRYQKTRRAASSGSGTQQLTFKPKKYPIRTPTHAHVGCLAVYIYDKDTGVPYGKDYYNVLPDGTQGSLRVRDLRNTEEDDEEEEEEDEEEDEEEEEE